MATGLRQLNDQQRTELELFLHCPLSALQQPNLSTKAQETLDTLEAVWSIQALKERHFDAWIAQLNALHKQQVYTM
jgi:hypothetical protein